MNQENFTAWICRYSRCLSECASLLNELDNRIGDGDHGSNMERGFRLAAEKVAAADHQSLGRLCNLVAMTLIGNVGGASGPLYGTAFLKLSSAWAEMDDIDGALLGDGLAQALVGIRARGKAEVGDKTMVDVWEPVTRFLRAEGDASRLAEMVAIAQRAALGTSKLEARKGRAAYLGARSVGTCDPGSVSSAILFEELAGIIGEGVERWPWQTLVS